MIDFKYADYAWEQAAAVLAIDSPAGFTGKAAVWVKEAFESLGFSARITNMWILWAAWFRKSRAMAG